MRYRQQHGDDTLILVFKNIRYIPIGSDEHMSTNDILYVTTSVIQNISAVHFEDLGNRLRDKYHLIQRNLVTFNLYNGLKADRNSISGFGQNRKQTES